MQAAQEAVQQVADSSKETANTGKMQIYPFLKLHDVQKKHYLGQAGVRVQIHIEDEKTSNFTN